MPRQVTLYTKPGCHLCNDVREDLWLLEAEFDIKVVEQDISASQELLARYQLLIPVVDVEGGAVLTPPISLRQLREAVGKQECD